MGWLCLTARKLALQTGAGVAMIYRLIIVISDTGCVVCTIPTLTTSFGASKLACQTCAGAAILPF